MNADKLSPYILIIHRPMAVISGACLLAELSPHPFKLLACSPFDMPGFEFERESGLEPGLHAVLIEPNG